MSIDVTPTPRSPSQTPDEELVRLLIVEDDEDDYLITRDLLDAADQLTFAVDWAASYEDALARIREQSHDVYLIDYRLGQRTGLELIREAFATRAGAPVIMLTGQARNQIDLEATALGTAEFLAKQGLDAETLERSIRLAISHQQAERHALAARASEDGIWDWDIAANRLYSSSQLSAILGLDADALEIRPQALFGLVAPDDVARLRNEIDAQLAGHTPSFDCEFRIRHRDGSWRWVEAHGLVSRDVDGAPVRMAGSLSDTTDRHVVQQRLEHEALHDQLTGLPNRTLFVDRVEQTLQRAARESAAGCALLFLDLDGFKQINDTLSHAVGDQLLVAFAQRIAGELRPGDTVARLGGDEFTILLEGIVQASEATVIAERVLRSMQRPFHVRDNDLSIGVSIGIALSEAGLSPEELISAADLAMYDAKRRGRGRWAIFDEQMHRRVTDRLARQQELREVIEHAQLEVHFQPIHDLSGDRVIGLEALARWPPHLSPLDPADFIAIAEEIGLIGPLGGHVMREAFGTLAVWRAEQLVPDELWVSINLSSRQLTDPQLVERLRGAVAESGLPAELVRLELLESSLAVIERSEILLTSLEEAGIGLHVDDFGSGHSSIGALHRLPVRALKVDRRLVADIAAPRSRAIARSVIALAHSMDIAAIGSGIENAQQRAILRELGCDGGQGRFLAPVLEAPGVPRLLAGAV